VLFSGSFDLDPYLARIGFTGDRAPTLRTLQRIALRHPLSIPFENLDAFLRRPIALDPASLQQKLVHRQRGGWCFEHNLLLGHALTELGFRVTGLAARVAWDVPPGAQRPRSHMVLRVDLDRPYIVDAGFGGLTLTGALVFEPGLEQETPHELFRIRAREGDFLVEAQVRGEWRPLYGFDEQPQTLPDYEVSNWYLCNFPQSHFLSTLIAARAGSDRRFALRNHELAIHHLDGTTERTALATTDGIRRALDELFHVRLPDDVDVEAAFERLLPAHT
jgi:N-hydroxyarylamine O-acetyltransferase